MNQPNVVPFRTPEQVTRCDEPLPAPFVELPARLQGTGGAVPAIAMVRPGPVLAVRCSRVAAGLLGGKTGRFLDPASLPPIDVSLYLPAFPARPRATLRCTVSEVSVPEPGTFLLTLLPQADADDDGTLDEFCARAFS